jgi:alanyl aminopeptidase
MLSRTGHPSSRVLLTRPPALPTRRWIPGLPLLLALACATQTSPPAGPHAAPPGSSNHGTAPSVPPPPALRLPDVARPLRQAVHLRLVPTIEDFSGSTDIEVDVRAPTSVIWLQAALLTVQRAEWRAGGETVRLNATASDEFLALTRDGGAPAWTPGRGTVHLEFSGKMPARDDRGVYRQEENGDWYVFTQFEATDARRAFPCFDEPSFKIPWQVTLDVPSDALAFANAPQVSETPAGASKKVVFAETKPLPSYLVAFAVGPLEIVDGGKAGRGHTQVRIIVPRGKTAEVAYAAKTTGAILERLENYFDIPYPYEKLDHVAVPQKGGAMENAGLITFGTDTIYGKPGQRDIDLERGYLHIAAHELGHMWFGDLVTAAWWDDIWLNEAFASWIDAKIVDEWHPDWDGPVRRVEQRGRAMGQDSLMSARRIRQPIQSHHDIENAFDTITYIKGEAIITMFEAYVGAPPFQKAVRSYLGRHANGNATAADFLGDVGAAVGQPEIFARAFSTFLDQPGLPLLSARLDCQPGKTAQVALEQQRYLPLGSPGAAVPAPQIWQIPVCVRHPGGRACSLVSEPRASIELPQSKTCPAWVMANAEATGYYRVQPQGDLLQRLLRGGGKSLSVAERLNVLGDMGALVRSARLPYGEALALVPALAKDQSRHIVASMADLVGGLSNSFVPDELRPRYQRFVTRAFGARARQLGWLPRPNDSDDTRLLRPTLLAAMVEDAEDVPMQVEARALADKWLADHKAVPPELVDLVLDGAARRGDRALWDKWLTAAKAEKDRADREHLLMGLGDFLDPALVAENLRLTLSDAFDPRESMMLLFGAAGDRRTRQAAYDFMKQHHDEILARMPPDFGGHLPGIGRGFCDSTHRQDIEAFFKDKIGRSRGGPRALAQILERIDLCIALHTAQQDSVRKFLAQQ